MIVRWRSFPLPLSLSPYIHIYIYISMVYLFVFEFITSIFTDQGLWSTLLFRAVNNNALSTLPEDFFLPLTQINQMWGNRNEMIYISLHWLFLVFALLCFSRLALTTLAVFFFHLFLCFPSELSHNNLTSLPFDLFSGLGSLYTL